MRANDAATLRSLIDSCISTGVCRHALLLRVDRLPSSVSRPHHLRLAEAALAPLSSISRAQMFHLPGPRYAVTWRGNADTVLLDVLDSLGHLLEDAPPGTPSLQDLVYLFELPSHGAQMLAACADADLDAPQVLPPAPPIDAAGLSSLEASLVQADVSRFARRRPVWTVGRGAPTLAWEKRTLSIDELAAELLPDHDVQADQWLFRRLTRTLDRRMLSLLTHSGVLAKAGPFSLDLNVASLLSPEFLRFDTALPAALRHHIIIEVMPADVMADVPAFLFARNFVRMRGYRLLLRHVTATLAALLCLPALELDYHQVDWSDQLTGQPLPPGCLDNNTLLGGVAGPEALHWGRLNAVRLYQGPAADELAAAERVVAG